MVIGRRPVRTSSADDAAGGVPAFRAAALAILVLAALLRFWALDFGLPNTLTRPDAYLVASAHFTGRIPSKLSTNTTHIRMP